MIQIDIPMPEACDVCPFNYDFCWCTAFGNNDEWEKYSDDWNDNVCDRETRPEYCPLKEQEAVEPHYNARTNWYECGVCHYSMTSGMHCRGELIPAYKVGFCAKCGRKQEWK